MNANARKLKVMFIHRLTKTNRAFSVDLYLWEKIRKEEIYIYIPDKNIYNIPYFIL